MMLPYAMCSGLYGIAFYALLPLDASSTAFSAGLGVLVAPTVLLLAVSSIQLGNALAPAQHPDVLRLLSAGCWLQLAVALPCLAALAVAVLFSIGDGVWWAGTLHAAVLSVGALATWRSLRWLRYQPPERIQAEP